MLLEAVRYAFILIGGLGTRLGSLVADTPKPMLDVGGEPFVVRVIRQLAGFGVTDVVLLTGYKSAVPEAYFARHAPVPGVRVQCLSEASPLGTAGALRAAAASLPPEFLLCNGDSYFECDLTQLMQSMRHSHTVARLALRAVAENMRYGAVMTQGDHVTAFAERDPAGAGGLMNAGLYWMRRDIVKCIPQNKPCSLEQTIFPALAADQRLEYTAFPDAFFIDIGIPEDLTRARAHWAEGQAPFHQKSFNRYSHKETPA